MNVNEAKKISFDGKRYEEWQEIATKSLKNLPFERLISKTMEGIDLYPLYTKNDEKLPSIASIIEAKERPNWTIAQESYGETSQAYMDNLLQSLARGNEAIVYTGTRPIEFEEKDLQELAKLVTTYPIYFYDVGAHDTILKVFDLLGADELQEVRGVISVESFSDVLFACPHVRSKGVNLVPVHHEGADAVTELALSLAYAREQVTASNSFEQMANNYYVRFAVDTHFFMEIAKLRAFRALWQAFSSAYGQAHTAVPILVETSTRSYSLIDPYVNLLRAGNSAFSAILGGANVCTVHPHDYYTGPSASSIRLARNVQVVIKEETFVNEVMDPAGGSYFIESLTKQLVEKAWDKFIEIEDLGGYHAYTTSASFRSYLDDCYQKRVTLLAEGKHSLVGTTVYADLTSQDSLTSIQTSTRRLAEPFEQFRKAFQQGQPKLAILPFGPLKDYKAKSDFVSSYFASGGLKTKLAPSFEHANEANKWLQENKVDYAFICANHEKTQAVLPYILEEKHATFIQVAGKFEAELAQKWKAQGLHGFLYKGLNKIEQFQEMLKQWEGELSNDDTKL